MKNLFINYGEVLHVDATYKTNKTRYPLYHFTTVDSFGLTRPIFFAFVKNKCQVNVDTIFYSFCKLMENINHIKLVFVDKDSTKINAIKKFLPQLKILLCSFHVEKSMEKKIRSLTNDKNIIYKLKTLSKQLIYCRVYKEFFNYINEIKSINSSYFTYLCKCWLNISDMWAQCMKKIV